MGAFVGSRRFFGIRPLKESSSIPTTRSGGALHRIREDVAERIDVIPVQFRVIVTRRPRPGCRRPRVR
jgi:transposase